MNGRRQKTRLDKIYQDQSYHAANDHVTERVVVQFVLGCKKQTTISPPPRPKFTLKLTPADHKKQFISLEIDEIVLDHGCRRLHHSRRCT